MRGPQILVIAMVIAVSGCSRGAAPPRGTVGVTLEDGRLSAAVRTALLNDPELGVRKIAVETRVGVVTLTGSVRSQEEVERAQRLAASVTGVRDVQSSLKIQP